MNNLQMEIYPPKISPAKASSALELINYLMFIFSLKKEREIGAPKN